jgi:hypothetical protein
MPSHQGQTSHVHGLHSWGRRSAHGGHQCRTLRRVVTLLMHGAKRVPVAHHTTLIPSTPRLFCYPQSRVVSLSTFCGTSRIIWHPWTVDNLIILLPGMSPPHMSEAKTIFLWYACHFCYDRTCPKTLLFGRLMAGYHTPSQSMPRA